MKYFFIYIILVFQEDINKIKIVKNHKMNVNGQRYFFRIYKRGIKNRVTIETDGQIELAHCDHVKTWTINLISQLRLIRIDPI